MATILTKHDIGPINMTLILTKHETEPDKNMTPSPTKHDTGTDEKSTDTFKSWI